MAYMNGREQLALLLAAKPPVQWPPPLWCVRSLPGERFLQVCRLGVLQYCLVRPTLAVLTLLLFLQGRFSTSDLSPSSPHLQTLVLNNLSVTISLYFLYMFYTVLREDLEPFRPWSKFLCVKAIIFFSFWQGVALFIAERMGLLTGIGLAPVPEESAQALQDFLIAVEMFLIALVHPQVFPVEPFLAAASSSSSLPLQLRPLESMSMESGVNGAVAGTGKPLLKGLKDVVNIADVIGDTVETIQGVKQQDRHSKET